MDYWSILWLRNSVPFNWCAVTVVFARVLVEVVGKQASERACTCTQKHFARLIKQLFTRLGTSTAELGPRNGKPNRIDAINYKRSAKWCASLVHEIENSEEISISYCIVWPRFNALLFLNKKMVNALETGKKARREMVNAQSTNDINISMRVTLGRTPFIHNSHI